MKPPTQKPLSKWDRATLTSHGLRPIIEDYDASEPIKTDYEPEQAYGTAEDFLKHKQYGGSREDN